MGYPCTTKSGSFSRIDTCSALKFFFSSLGFRNNSLVDGIMNISEEVEFNQSILKNYCYYPELGYHSWCPLDSSKKTTHPDPGKGHITQCFL